MSRINLNNYEAFWLDYVEGSLSSEDAAEFLLFAAQYPELAIDLEDELVYLNQDSASTLNNSEKEALKEIAELEVLIVQEMDNELSSTSRLNQLKNKYPEQYIELTKAFQNTRLVSTVTYASKSDLKQPTVISMYWRVAVAAALIGVIATFFPWGSFTHSNQVAEKSKPSILVEPAALKEIGPRSLVNHKTFNFEQQEEKEMQGTPSPIFTNESSIADENSTPKDAINDVEFTQPLENNDLALDTTDQNEVPVTYLANEKDSVQQVPSVMDQDADQELASNTPSTPKDLTVPEFLAEKVLKVEKQDKEPLLASIIDQKTNWDVAYDEAESADKKVTKFKLGKFEFYRSAKK
ncbi:hypothetical protein [Parvicella tangerina]|uniref:Uncharacterized protein n=1 Tax=Parvicella tangerina TaxID=2829795 RepID=A0A916NES9_9FLAO|nr:hypothetical protein [Parvicella tangerina]CAG5076933.1 hypothetical protein CRYO30217_00248 [Parvicella tangerina]